MKALVLFYSTYGHIWKMAEAVAEGVREAAGSEAVLKRIPETLPKDVLIKMGALEAQKAYAHIPEATVDELPEYDAILFGVPTRYGVSAAQVRAFLDGTGKLWATHTLVGKVGSVFCSTATQHGGQESTILSLHATLLHLGMVIVGLPYTFQGQTRLDEVTGCSPYGASTIAGSKGERMPSANELDGARFQGRHVATLAGRLAMEPSPA
jgi:NAD(P)H dehydrogenase (quinone)